MYHYLGPNREPLGPVPIETLREMIARGELGPDDLVWAEGWADWQAARTVEGLFPEEAPAAGPAAGPAGPATGSMPPAEAPVEPRVEAPPIVAGPVVAMRRSPWAIEAMPPANYTPDVFKKLNLWYMLTLIGAVAFTFVGLVVLIVGAVMAENTGGDGGAVIAGVGGLLALVGVPFSIAAAILWYMLLYKAWRQIQDGHAQTGPGKAVGFLFIPLFSLYWFFIAVYGLADDLHKYADRWGIEIRRPSKGLGMTVCVLYIVTSFLPYLNILTGLALIPLFAWYTHQFQRASQDIAVALAQRGGAPTGSNPSGGCTAMM